MMSDDRETKFLNKILKVMSEGQPFEEYELWFKVAGDHWPTRDEFTKYMHILEDKKMIKHKTITISIDSGCSCCDCEERGYNDEEITIWWTPYFEQTIDKEKEAKSIAKAHITAVISQLKISVDQLEKEAMKNVK